MGQLYNITAAIGRIDAWVTCCGCCILASAVLLWGAGVLNDKGEVQQPPQDGSARRQRMPIALVAACSMLLCALLYVYAVSSSKQLAAGAGVLSIADAVTSPFSWN